MARRDATWCYYSWPDGPPVTSDEAGDECPASADVGDVREVWISWENVAWNHSPLSDNLRVAVPTAALALGVMARGCILLARSARPSSADPPNAAAAG